MKAQPEIGRGIFFRTGSLFALFLVAVFSLPACAHGINFEVSQGSEAIAWIPTIKQGFEEARKLNKPIMLISAAPQCAGVSGVW